MPSRDKTFRPFPHDWQSADYVAGWIEHDITRDSERRPLLRRMLAAPPFPSAPELRVLDIGAGYGVVTEEVLSAFPAARVTLQDYSPAMLDQARQRLAAHADRLSFVLCDLLDPAWPQKVGGSFDLAVSAIVLHNLGRRERIFGSYPAVHALLRPSGWFLNYDRFIGGVEKHLTELRSVGFAHAECTWQQPPHAIIVAARSTAKVDL
ncbi:MAG: class I SAM-dependent methyltransferase [Alphaproteobacteria bacterium]|nr:class I SAM-dependent methyltransferase [Alphaproteobacteria bacterium]